jgi:hypothetical protein
MGQMFSVADVVFALTTMWYSDVIGGERVQWFAIFPTSCVNSLFFHTKNLLSLWQVLVLSTAHCLPFTLLTDTSTIADLELSLTVVTDPDIVVLKAECLVEDTLLL